MKESAHLEELRRFRLQPLALCLAVLLGGISGLAAALVRLGFRGLQWVFTHSAAALPIAAAGLAPWRRVLIPLLGAGCATTVLAVRVWRDRRLRRKPAPYVEYVEAVRLGHGRIPLGVNAWRTSASAFSVATGAPIGREGSMIQFAAAVTSALHRFTGLRWPRAKQLPPALAVACGVAAGVTVAYHAPIAATLFASEIVLGELDMRALVLMALAAAAGMGVSHALVGSEPLYRVAQPLAVSGRDWAVLLAMAAVFGVLGPLYQRWLKFWTIGRKLPLALLAAALLTGGLSLIDPRVWGNGDVGLSAALGLTSAHGAFATTAGALALLLGLRLLATGVATGLGTVGGVFTPTLLAGGLTAALAAHAFHLGDPVLFAVVGMAALIAAATHAPLMAAVMAVELTGQWPLLPLLLAASGIAWLVARALSSDALYAIASEHPVHEGLPPPHHRVFGGAGRSSN